MKGGIEMKKFVVFITVILFCILLTVPCFARDDDGGGKLNENVTLDAVQ